MSGVILASGVLHAQVPAVVEEGGSGIVRSAEQMTQIGTQIATRTERAVQAVDNASAALASPTYPLALPATKVEKIALSEAEMAKISDQVFRVISHQSPVENVYPHLTKTFQVVSLYPDQFSGVFFEVDGKVFGATAAHIFRNKPQALNRPVLTSIYTKGEWTPVVGEVVAINPMLDIALLAFEQGSAPVIKNVFQLETHLPPVGEKLSSHGFLSQNRAVNVPARTVLERTPFSIRTSWPWPRVYRPGLCGSGVANEEGKLVGMHIGSSKAEDADDDVGYVVPAWYLQMMARSYLNGGKETFPLLWNETKIADLRADEFVATVTLQDEKGRVLWEKDVQPYFPYTQLRQKVQELSPASLEFTIQKMQFSTTSSAGWYASDSRKIRYTFKNNFVSQTKVFVPKQASRLIPSVPEQITPEFLATFQARPLGDVKSNFVSGTMFQTQYNGQTKVFGIIAAHTVAPKESSEMIGRYFLADVFDSETHQFVTIPAEIVQVSSADFLDGALVRLYPEGKVTLHPLELNTEFPQYESVLKSHGFAHGENVAMNDRVALRHTPFNIYTTLSDTQSDLMGTCGGVVVDANNKIVGFQTGMDSSPFGESHDTGYVAPAWIMDLLVRAYHNGGQAQFPLSFEGNTLLKLNVDEYITDIRFLSRSQEELFAHTFVHKFSYRKMREWLEIFQPHFVEITVRHVEWAGPNRSYLYSERTDAANGQVYRYNFKTKQTEFLGTEEEVISKRLFNREGF